MQGAGMGHLVAGRALVCCGLSVRVCDCEPGTAGTWRAQLLAWGWIGTFAWHQFGPSCSVAVQGTGSIPCLGSCDLEESSSLPSIHRAPFHCQRNCSAPAQSCFLPWLLPGALELTCANGFLSFALKAPCPSPGGIPWCHPGSLLKVIKTSLRAAQGRRSLCWRRSCWMKFPGLQCTWKNTEVFFS